MASGTPSLLQVDGLGDCLLLLQPGRARPRKFGQRSAVLDATAGEVRRSGLVEGLLKKACDVLGSGWGHFVDLRWDGSRAYVVRLSRV
mgnify:FL=1|jgi:hypothetical protein